MLDDTTILKVGEFDARKLEELDLPVDVIDGAAELAQKAIEKGNSVKEVVAEE